MRMARSIGIAATIALAGTAGAATAKPRLTGEQQLAKLLEGRVAEAPKSCITTWPSSDMQIIDRTAIVFGRGNVIYVNRTRDPSTLDDDDVLVFRKFGSGSQTCSADTVTTIDRISHFYNGNVFLSEFVPYRRVK